MNFEWMIFLPITIVPLLLLIWLGKVWIEMIQETRRLVQEVRKK